MLFVLGGILAIFLSVYTCIYVWYYVVWPQVYYTRFHFHKHTYKQTHTHEHHHVFDRHFDTNSVSESGSANVDTDADTASTQTHRHQWAYSFANNEDLLNRKLSPTWYGAHQILQGLIANELRASLPYEFERELLEMDDGEIIALDWLQPTPTPMPTPTPALSDDDYDNEDDTEFGTASLIRKHAIDSLPESDASDSDASDSDSDSHSDSDSVCEQDTTPTVIFLHGISGGSHETNVQWALKPFHDAKFRTVVYHRRGCAKHVPLQVHGLYQYGNTHDMRQVVDHITHRYPNSPLYAVGLSAGSNTLVKYLGEAGTDTPIHAAVSVCNAFDLEKTSIELAKKPLYDRMMTMKLQNNLFRPHIEKFRAIPGLSISDIQNATSVREFDALFTCRMYGYSNVSEFYQANSSARYVPHVQIPLLCINSLDDPIIPDCVLPREAICSNPNIMHVVTDCGGHLGWIEGWNPFHRTTWADDLCLNFVQHIKRTVPMSHSSHKPQVRHISVSCGDVTVNDRLPHRQLRRSPSHQVLVPHSISNPSSSSPASSSNDLESTHHSQAALGDLISHQSAAYSRTQLVSRFLNARSPSGRLRYVTSDEFALHLYNALGGTSNVDTPEEAAAVAMTVDDTNTRSESEAEDEDGDEDGDEDEDTNPGMLSTMTDDSRHRCRRRQRRSNRKRSSWEAASPIHQTRGPRIRIISSHLRKRAKK
jgi:predicted alpha/beta-fold hydrolase